MPHALSAVVARAGRAAVRVADPDPGDTDGRLLTHFVQAGDGQAFAELVRRVGPMVLGVCRRVSGDAHLAEDAFQATFLVLARKAAGVCPREAVRGWLHGVAVRAAREARAVSARRLARELPVATLPERLAPVCPTADSDALAALDEEVAALPEHLRVAVVLCELECVARKEAAARLGVPEGTLSSRLAKARKVLAARLNRRGVALSAALAVVGQAAATVPPRLVNQTAQIATASGPVSPAVATLTNGVFRAMFLRKLSAVPVAGALALALLAGALTASAVPPPPAIRPAPAAAQPAPNPAPREGEIVVWRKGHAGLFKPDGTKLREWKGDDVPEPGGVRLSPDGKTIAVLRPYETRTLKQNVDVGGACLAGTFSRHLYRITLYPVAEKLTGTDVMIPGDSVEIVLWSADGSKLYAATHADDEHYSREIDLKHYVIDLATRKHTELKLPARHHLKDVSPDGKLFLTQGPGVLPAAPRRWFLVPAAGGDPRLLAARAEVIYDGHFSADGKRVLLCGLRVGGKQPPAAAGGAAPPPVDPPHGYLLETATLDKPTERTSLVLREREYANQCRWSPDGKKVVTARQVLPELNQPAPQKEVVVTDADGKNPKALTADTGKYLEPVCIDWR